MTNTNQPESTSARLDRLESLLADIGDVVLSGSDMISRHDEALAQLEAQTTRNARAIEALTASVTDLARTAAQEAIQANADRQQAIIDRQVWQAEIL